MKKYKGCGVRFLYEYGMGEEMWVTCGEFLDEPEEQTLCDYCRGKYKLGR